MICNKIKTIRPLPVSFGIGGIINGPEFRSSYAIHHLHIINLIRKSLFLNELVYKDIPGISITLIVAGQLEPHHETKVGDIRFSKKFKEFDVQVSLSLRTFTEQSEADFRELFSQLIEEAVEKVLHDKRVNEIAVDGAIFRRYIQMLIDEYRALDLPIIFVAPEKSELPQADLRPEYFFLFRDLSSARRFIEQLDLTRFETDWDSEEQEEDYYIRIVDVVNMKRVRKVERELIKLAEDSGGEYDGWSAV